MCSRTQENNKNKVGPVIWDTLYLFHQAGGVQPGAGDEAGPHDRAEGQDEGDLPGDGHTGAAALSTPATSGRRRKQ